MTLVESPPVAPPPLRVLVLTNMWPTQDHPHYGVWVESHVRSVVERGVSVRVHFINGRRTRWAYARSALRIMALGYGRRKYDLVHAQSGYSGALAMLQGRVPVLTSYMGSCDLLGDPGRDWRVPLKSRVETAIFRQLARCFDHTITMSTEMERRLPAAARARNSVLPHGVDRSLFRPMPQMTARAALGWPAEDRVVLFVGDTENKRLDLAMAAVALARAEFPGLALRQCAGVPQEEVPLWMNAADALIVTSNVEGSPNMVKEAMSCDLPIVSVDVGDVRQVIEGTRNCRITARDPEALAAGLCGVLRAAPERSDGRSRTEHLAIAAIAERLIGIYLQTVQRASARGPAARQTGRK